MTRGQKKQFRQRFRQHRYPIKTFRGDPTRPAYLVQLVGLPNLLGGRKRVGRAGSAVAPEPAADGGTAGRARRVLRERGSALG